MFASLSGGNGDFFFNGGGGGDIDGIDPVPLAHLGPRAEGFGGFVFGGKIFCFFERSTRASG